MLLAVGTYRYVSQRSDEPLRTRLVKLAREKPRFGRRRAAPQVMRAPLSIYPSDENISFSLVLLLRELLSGERLYQRCGFAPLHCGRGIAADLPQDYQESSEHLQNPIQ